MLPNLLLAANGGVGFDFVGLTQSVGIAGGRSADIAGTGCQPGDLIIITAASNNVLPVLVSGFTNVFSGDEASVRLRIQSRVRQAGDANSVSVIVSATRGTVGCYAWRPKAPIQTTISASLASGGVVPLAVGDGVFRGVFCWEYNSGSPFIPNDSDYFDYQHNVNNGNITHLWTGLRRFAVAAPDYTHGNGQGYYNIITNKA